MELPFGQTHLNNLAQLLNTAANEVKKTENGVKKAANEITTAMDEKSENRASVSSTPSLYDCSSFNQLQ